MLPQGGSSSGALISSDGSFYSLIMLLFTPFSFLWGLVSSFINPPPSRGVGGAAATPSGASSGGSGNTLGGQAAASRATRSGNVGNNNIIFYCYLDYFISMSIIKPFTNLRLMIYLAPLFKE